MPEARLTIRADSVAEAGAKFKILRRDMADVEKQAKLIRSEGLMMGQALRMNVAVDSQRAAAGAAMTWQGRLKGVGAQIMSIRGMMIGAGAYMGGSMLLGAMREGAAAEKAERAYTRMGGKVKDLERVKDAVHGVASASELAGVSARMMAQNQNLDSAAAAKLLIFAKRNADLMGGEWLENAEAVNDAVRSGRDISLKRVGLVPVEEKTVRALAASEGIHAHKLNKTTEARLKTLAVLKQIDAVLAKHPPGTPTPGENLTAAEINLKEMREQVGRVALRAGSSRFRGVADLLSGKPSFHSLLMLSPLASQVYAPLFAGGGGAPAPAAPPEVKIKTVRASSIRLRDAAGVD